MKKIPVLWWLMIASCLTAFLLFPSKRELNQNKDELATVKNELKAKKEVAKQDFPISDDFDLIKSETDAQKRLTEAFSVVYGGLHSKEDLEQHKTMIKKYLGKKLAQEALLDSYNQDDFFLEKNIETRVGIENVTNKKECNILVIVTYQMKNGGNTYSKIYELKYDLTDQSVLSYTVDNIRGKR